MDEGKFLALVEHLAELGKNPKKGDRRVDLLTHAKLAAAHYGAVAVVRCLLGEGFGPQGTLGLARGMLRNLGIEPELAEAAAGWLDTVIDDMLATPPPGSVAEETVARWRTGVGFGRSPYEFLHGRRWQVFVLQYPSETERRDFVTSINFLATNALRLDDESTAVHDLTELLNKLSVGPDERALALACTLLTFGFHDGFDLALLDLLSWSVSDMRDHHRRILDRTADRELGTNRGRTIEIDSLDATPDAQLTWQDRGFKNVDDRLELEQILAPLSPAERAAIREWLEVDGDTAAFKEMRREKGGSPQAGERALKRARQRLRAPRQG